MVRVVHYVNQFFAGVGGEERAGEAPGVKAGPLGPGLALKAALGGDGSIEATVWCGDNYMAAGGEEAVDAVVAAIEQYRPDVVVAGPAFASGRYGLACGKVAAAVRSKLGVPTVIGLHESNPAVDAYRQKTIIVPTRDSAAGMRAAMADLARLAVRLGHGETLGPAHTEGYMPTGIRRNAQAGDRGAKRAVSMLVQRLRGLPFRTEFELPRYDTIAPAAPVADLSTATVALVTESGCVPTGNPDGILSSWASHWVTYPLAEMSELHPGEWQFVHGGFDVTFVNEDPHRCVPLDAMRRLEKLGAYGRLHDQLLTTCGNMAPLSTAVRFGQEMAHALKRANVQAAVLTAT